MLNVGHYFASNWKQHSRVHLGAVARAIEFFGGSLVIDWGIVDVMAEPPPVL